MSDKEQPQSSVTTNALVLWSPKALVEDHFAPMGGTSPSTSNGGTMIDSHIQSPVLSPSAAEFIPGAAIHVPRLAESVDSQRREGSQDDDKGGVLLTSPREAQGAQERSYSLEEDEEDSETRDTFSVFGSRLTKVTEGVSELYSARTPLTMSVQRKPTNSNIALRVQSSEMSAFGVVTRLWPSKNPANLTAREDVHDSNLGPSGPTINDQFMQHRRNSLGPDDRGSEGEWSNNNASRLPRSTGRNNLATNSSAHQTYEPAAQRTSRRNSTFVNDTLPALVHGMQRRGLDHSVLNRGRAPLPVTQAALDRYCRSPAYKDRNERIANWNVGQIGSAAVYPPALVNSANNRSMVPTSYRTVESFVPNRWAPVISVSRVPVTELSTAVYNTISRQPSAASTSTWGIHNNLHQQMPNINPNVRISGAATSVPPAHPTLPFQPHGDAMYPNGPHPSQKYQRLMYHSLPSYDAAIQEEYLPFYEAGRSTIPAQWGVIKITEAPYDVTKQEIRDHLGQNARILTHHHGEAIHIIMDRANGKTGEVYVEFFSPKDAQAYITNWALVGKSKIRDRFINVQMSSQEALMGRLFPKAKNVIWNRQVPIVVRPQPPFTGFRSFIDQEELLQMGKLADIATRRHDSYSWKSPQRVYENMISVLYKFPWFAVDHYTVADCNRLYWAVFNLTQELMNVLNSTTDQRQFTHRRQHTYTGPLRQGPGAAPLGPLPRLPLPGPPRLTPNLLRDLVYAALNAPGIFDRCKSHLLATVMKRMPLSNGFDVKMSLQTWNWPWVVLTRKPDWEEDLIVGYMKLLNVGEGLLKAENDIDFGAIDLAHAPTTFRMGTYLLPIEDENVTVAERGSQERQMLEAVLRLVLS